MVGDMAMYWVPDSSNPKPEEIMAGLTHVQTQAPGQLKMAFVRCKDVYEVSFHAKVPDDLYGADIDLTARLLERARPSEILLNSECREDVIRNIKGVDYSISSPLKKGRSIE